MPKLKTLIDAKYNPRWLINPKSRMVRLDFCDSFDLMAKTIQLDYLLETIDLLRKKYDEVIGSNVVDIKTKGNQQKEKIIDFPNQLQQKTDNKSEEE